MELEEFIRTVLQQVKNACRESGYELCGEVTIDAVVTTNKGYIFVPRNSSLSSKVSIRLYPYSNVRGIWEKEGADEQVNKGDQP